MAQTVRTVLVNDLNGEPAAETVQFSIDDRNYELELTQDNAQQLRAALKDYVRAARPVPPRKSAPEGARIRAWAQANGYEVAPHGRIHRDVIQAYHQAI